MTTTEINTCTQPLTSGDFNWFDHVADEKLFLDEIGHQNIPCFVKRLILTNDIAARKIHIDAFQNDLREAVIKELQEQRRTEKSEEILSRIDNLLRDELSDQVVRGSVYVSYQYDSVTSDLSGAYSETQQKAIHIMTGSGSIVIDQPFEKWRLLANLELTGINTWQHQEANSSDETFSNFDQDYFFPGVGTETSLSIFKRNEAAKLIVAGVYYHHFTDAPDAMQYYAGANASGSLRNIGDTPLATKASVTWDRRRHEPPLTSQYSTPQLDTLSAMWESSYDFGPISAVLLYEYEDANLTSHYYRNGNLSNAGSILAHFGSDWGYIRLGSGGGAWSNSITTAGGINNTEAKGGECHARLETLWRLSEILLISGKLKGTANYSDEGTFSGWHPSWGSELRLTLSFKSFSLAANLNYSGFHRDLEELQDKHSLTGSADFTYHPSDAFRMGINASYYRFVQSGYQEMTENSWDITPSLAVRILSDTPLWATIEGWYSNHSFEEDINQANTMNFGGHLSLSLKL